MVKGFSRNNNCNSFYVQYILLYVSSFFADAVRTSYNTQVDTGRFARPPKRDSQSMRTRTYTYYIHGKYNHDDPFFFFCVGRTLHFACTYM